MSDNKFQGVGGHYKLSPPWHDYLPVEPCDRHVQHQWYIGRDADGHRVWRCLQCMTESKPNAEREMEDG